MKRRGLVVVLCLAMLISFLPNHASAAEGIASELLWEESLARDITTIEMVENSQEQPGDSAKCFVSPVIQKTSVPDGYIAITTVEELDQIREYAWESKNFILMSDLDLGGVTWDPIGTPNGPFTGLFDGNGHTISNLYIDTGDHNYYSPYVGLFGYAPEATIKNLNLSNAKIITDNSYDYVGSVAAFAEVVENCSSDCMVTATCIYGGGIVGNADTVLKCYFTGNVQFSYEKYNQYSDTQYTAYGGICGNASTIQECLNKGAVRAEIPLYQGITISFLGGVIGTGRYIDSCSNLAAVYQSGRGSSLHLFTGGILGGSISSPVISNCGNFGNVTVESQDYAGMVGGIAGGSPSQTWIFYACFNVGILTNMSKYRYDWYIGAIIGFGSEIWLRSCYKNQYKFAGDGNRDSDIVYSENIATLTPAEFTNPSSFVGFDFTSIWELSSGMTAPQLRIFHSLLESDTESPILPGGSAQLDHFGHYGGVTQNIVALPDGANRFILDTVTIEGTVYPIAESLSTSFASFPVLRAENYLDTYTFIAYNLNDQNEITAANVTSGQICTLTGWNAAEQIVETDYFQIPIGETALEPGCYQVCNMANNTFPYDQIQNWVGDQVRIYTVGEEIYKVVHITNGYGQLTRTDLTASPMIAEIDGVDYPVVAGDAGLAETIRAFPPGSQVSYTLYDGVIVEMASAEIPTLRVSINNPGNTYYVGEYICVLASDCLDTPSGTVRSMPINPVVSVSDEAILSLENTITSLPDIFSILGLGKGIGLEDDTFVCYTFRANAPGNVAIHIGDDSTNGRQLTIPIAISVDPHAGMRADDVEIYEWDLLGSEDYYNEIVNGMVISDFNCTRRDDGDSEYRFNVYNRSTLLGVAEVYDAAGNLIDIRIIDKASMPTDLKSTVAETWNGLIKPIVTDQDLFSFRGSGSKRTDFTSNPILVPEGGHVKITNSMAISVPCLLLNSMDITLEGIGFLKGSVDVAEITSASAKQTLLRQVLKTYLTPEGQQDILSQIAKSSLSSAGQADIVAMFTDISGFAAEICDIVLASSHDTVVNTTIRMVQNTLESSGYGSALQVAFFATGIGNLIIQINQFSDSLSSDRAMTVYTPNDRQATVLAASHSVQLQAASVMGADTVLCADMIAVSDWSKPHTADSQSCLCYDLSLQTAGCEISLPSASTVTFPLPSGTWEDLRLYYLKPDTKRWEELSYTIEGAQITTEVNSLGQFALVDGALLDNLPQDTRKYTIKFDANGGYCATKSIELKSAGTLPYLPTAYRSGNWKFAGWYNAPSGGYQYTDTTVFGANATLYAHWMKTDGPESSNLYISTSIYKDEKVSALITNRTEAPSDGIFVAAVYDESGKMLGIKYTEMVLQSQKTLVLTIDAVNTDTIYMLRVFVMDSQSYQPIYPAWEMKFPDEEKLV